MSRTNWLSCLISICALAPAAVAANRVPAKVDDSQRVFLRGHVTSRILHAQDQGAITPDFELVNLTMRFQPSAAQQADLDTLLRDQQDPSSPEFHRWLTPEQYGQRFGLGDADIAAVQAWLKSQGLTATSVGRGRSHLNFDGTAQAVQKAFRIEIHKFLADGESHYSNISEPSIPAALQPVIAGIRGLNDFVPKPHYVAKALPPNYTSQTSGNHYIGPDDFATIYDLTALYSSGLDGSGQTIAIVGQTAVDVTDIQQFRAYFNLDGQDPQLLLVPTSKNPGTKKNDLGEADLDIEWSYSAARNAKIIYVYASSVDISLQYAIDQNLAPVVSMSYGLCEQSGGSSYAAQLRALAQQANSQGMTWLTASGDNGGADCAGQSATNNTLSVDLPGSVPEVTAVGGTEFNDFAGTYWNATNDTHKLSALAYIPERAWNDTVNDGQPSASGGGASIVFAKPAWQTGAGVPNDGVRDVPDVSLNASASHDGYIFYTNGAIGAVGGTSVSAPLFAGITAIVNQAAVQSGMQKTPGLGNINPKLYQLAQTNPEAFHDIVDGSNFVNVNCKTARACSTDQVGYLAGTGYDQATGLGSVDAFNLVAAWTGTSGSRAAPRIAVTGSPMSVPAGGKTTLTATLSSGDAGKTPAGSVTFLLGTFALGTAPLAGSNGSATATLDVGSSQFVAGNNAITAIYNSDSGAFSATRATINISVSEDSTLPTIAGVADGASFSQSFAPGGVLSIFGSNLADATQLADAVPLPVSMANVSVKINQFNAPLYFVSAGQINVQIPYEIPVNSSVNVSVLHNGQLANASIRLTSTAPEIFTDGQGHPVPDASAKTSDVITLFVSGAGLVTPAVKTGAAPAAGTVVASLPQPIGKAVSVTVGGVNAPLQFVGVPTGMVGALQVNYQVPSGLAPGLQPVVVTIGGATSAQTNLLITN